MLSIYNINDNILDIPSHHSIHNNNVNNNFRSKLNDNNSRNGYKLGAKNTHKSSKDVKNESYLIITGTVNDPIYIPADNSNLEDNVEDNIENHNIVPNNDAIQTKTSLKHKYLLKLRKKQFANNFDLGLYFLIRYGGPKNLFTLIALNDPELMECSELTKIKNDIRALHMYYNNIYSSIYARYLSVRGMNGRTSMDSAGYDNEGMSKQEQARLNKTLCKYITKKKWFNNEKLYNKLVVQKYWNPFSIFGTTVPHINVGEIFSNYNIDHSIYNSGPVNGASRARKNNRDTIWYLNITNKYIDKSQNVYILQKCSNSR